MSRHVLDWLGAYHDGELRGDRLRRVEAHLRACAACRAELEALESLSALLQASPAMPARTAPERFVAQVQLRLSARPGPSDGARLMRAAWTGLPLALLGVWAFFQSVLLVSGLALLALPWAGGAPEVGTPAWPVGGGLVELFVLEVGLTVVLAGLLWGWLAGWWAARRTSVNSSGAGAG